MSFFDENAPWPTKPFGEVLHIRKGSIDPRNHPSEVFELFSIPAYDEGKGPEKLIGEAIGSSKTVVGPGDCLFSKLNPRIPRTWVVSQSKGYRQICSTEFWPIRSRFSKKDKEYLDPEFIKWLFRFETFLDEFRGNVSGGVQSRQRLKQDDLLGAIVPLPTLEEQTRIVTRIEELCRRVRSARKLRSGAAESADKSLASAIDAIFLNPDESWTTATVKQICGNPQYGFTESASVERIGPHFLRITDIQNGHVNWDTVPYCACGEKDKYLLTTGDIVFARTGATTGKSYLVEHPPEAVFASYLIRIRPGTRVIPEFIWWYFQSSSYWAAVYSGIDDGNRPNMNGTKLGNLVIPFPESKDVQRDIVARIDSIATKMDELRRIQDDTERELETFLPALLAKAFRGEL